MRGDPFANDEIETLPKLEELEVHYQPIVDLECGRIAGFEALVRWRHPQRGLLHPDAFLLLAEQTGYIEEIDRWVRERAVHQLAQWQKQFPTMLPLWMSVNLSVSDLGDSALVSSIANLIARTGISASSLVIEITESVLLDDTQQTHNFLRRISDLGVGLALDDFGTAFSSVSYIHRFPFNHLKLDISFTDELPHSLRSMLLVEEIGHLADSMKMTGTAEGIERQDQLDALREIGWKFGQGYLFSPALPADECEQLFARSSMFPQLSDLAN
jgi:EAL domain-containing protein (putative c-di-GMP-specific phosphodiesterase class I)